MELDGAGAEVERRWSGAVVGWMSSWKDGVGFPLRLSRSSVENAECRWQIAGFRPMKDTGQICVDSDGWEMEMERWRCEMEERGEVMGGWGDGEMEIWRYGVMGEGRDGDAEMEKWRDGEMER